MKRIFLFLTLLAFGFTGRDYQPNKEEARSAFTYLNGIRQNPENYLQRFSFLKGLKGMPLLKWNDTLARVAEARALDLARRNYFAHVDPDGYGVNHYIGESGYKLEPSWLKEKDANYFESLNAGSSSGKDAIERLIIDANVSSLGHRKHLLGLDSWNGSLKDIGIGFVPGDEHTSYISYTCIIIAKHSW
jgi:uncharacterized protein YkwD